MCPCAWSMAWLPCVLWTSNASSSGLKRRDCASRLDLPVQPARPFELDVLNCMLTATLSVNGGPSLAPTPIEGHAAGCRFSLLLDGPSVLKRCSHRPRTRQALRLRRAERRTDGGRRGARHLRTHEPRSRAAVRGVHRDLVDHGTRSELQRFQRELGDPRDPFFSTVGNHEMGRRRGAGTTCSAPSTCTSTTPASPSRWWIPAMRPSTRRYTSGWRIGSASRTGTHIVLTHVPPLDPAGFVEVAFAVARKPSNT